MPRPLLALLLVVTAAFGAGPAAAGLLAAGERAPERAPREPHEAAPPRPSAPTDLPEDSAVGRMGHMALGVVATAVQVAAYGSCRVFGGEEYDCLLYADRLSRAASARDPDTAIDRGAT